MPDVDPERQADRRREKVFQELSADSRNELGQYFTPLAGARLLAALPNFSGNEKNFEKTWPIREKLRILDAGAGTGMLSLAVIARLARERPAAHIELVAIEKDSALIPHLQQTMDDCAKLAADAGMSLDICVVSGDWLEMMLAATRSGQAPEWLAAGFHIVITNPPYRKLRQGRERSAYESAWGVTCPNMYVAFLVAGIISLDSGGQLVALTPRSFMNGTYFKEFRRFLLGEVALERIHLTESRTAMFSDGDVLQEVVMIAGTKGGACHQVMVTHSSTHEDNSVSATVNFDQVVLPGDEEQFIRVPLGEAALEAARRVGSAPCSHVDIGIKVSTGKVVDFRKKDRLSFDKTQASVPLVYPGNLSGGHIEHPRAIGKAQYFVVRGVEESRLTFPAGNYVIVKRFVGKEEARRIVAGVWLTREHEHQPVAFENHVNVLHDDAGGLSEDLALGMAAWLNSPLVDEYFRSFFGHTQVNASDLRSLRWPTREVLTLIGRGHRSVATA